MTDDQKRGRESFFKYAIENQRKIIKEAEALIAKYRRMAEEENIDVSNY